MDAIAGHLLEPTPTTLEITGFSLEVSEHLRALLVEGLQQPSYASHVRLLAEKSTSHERGTTVKSITFACPLGVIIGVEWEYGPKEAVLLTEFCVTCGKNYSFSDVDSCSCSASRPALPLSLTFDPYLDGLTAEGHLGPDEEPLPTGQTELALQKLERRLTNCSEVDVLSATLIAGELMSLIDVLVEHNYSSH